MGDLTRAELEKILENHRHWLNEDCDGWEDMRVNLSGADLRGVNLSGADLRGASLSGVNLSGADLSGVNLSGADLSGSDLCAASLGGAHLCGANLCVADLYRANLYLADLCLADLRGVNLSGAELSGVNLSGANLCGADLCGADLRGAILSGVKNAPFIPYSCPDFGMFIGFKKAQGYIVALEIPEDARRLSATGRKCRCDKAKVLAIQTIDGETADVTEVHSDRDPSFVYKVGETVSVDNFDECRWNECSTGIHFFINRQEAVEYTI